jgi:hypothetical protein
MKECWPQDFVRFSHAKLDLAPQGYRRFVASLTNVRTPFLCAEEGGMGNADPGYEPSGGDHRTRTLRQVVERRGQAAFRNALRGRYDNRCVVTGCKILDLLEAAHIRPYRGDGDNHPENGLLLRADIHTLFDLDLLGIDAGDLRVALHPTISGEYSPLNGKHLICHKDARPSHAALALRHAQFLARCKAPK